MSQKRVSGCDHGKLEFLGGRLDPGESSFTALIRELQEEEPTGRLAKLVRKREPHCYEIATHGARHFLFPLVISKKCLAQLQFCDVESLGLVQIKHRELVPGDGFTSRTNQLIDNLLKHDPTGLLVA